MTLGLLVVSGKSVTHTATHKKACGGRCVCCGMAQFGEWSLTVWSSVVFCLSLFFHEPDRRGKRERERKRSYSGDIWLILPVVICLC